MPQILKIAPCLWFDHQAEDAARYYVSIFHNSRICAVSHYGKAGHEVHGQPEGKVLTVTFELDGQPFTALNGGPHFVFNEAVSLQIYCETQQEIDYYWDKLTTEGDTKAQQCGWLKDRFGLSWQIVPTELGELLQSKDSEKGKRVMQAMLQMVKIDLQKLKDA